MQIEPVSAISAVSASAPVFAAEAPERLTAVDAVVPTHASTCTGFDPVACQPNLAQAGIAAAAAAQDYRVFMRRPGRAG